MTVASCYGFDLWCKSTAVTVSRLLWILWIDESVVWIAEGPLQGEMRIKLSMILLRKNFEKLTLKSQRYRSILHNFVFLHLPGFMMIRISSGL